MPHLLTTGSQDKYTSLEFNKVHEFDCDVAKIQCGYDHTMVLLKDNRIFAVGKLPGASSQLNEYTLITSVPHSPFDRVDIAVSKFNYPSYILGKCEHFYHRKVYVSRSKLSNIPHDCS